jgi:hypothetical protein
MSRSKRTIDANPLINSDGTISARPCSINDFVTLYGVSAKTMRKWLLPFRAELGEMRTYVFTVKQVNIIFAKLGKPKSYDLQGMKMVA